MKHLITKILVLAFFGIASIQVNAGVFNDTICSGTPITIGNVYPTATLYQWNTVPPQYTPIITVSPTVNTTYIVNVFAGTTWLLADTFNVAIKPLPNGTITPNQSICSGENTTLTATGGVTYLWSPGGMTTASIVVMPSTTTTYSVVITGTNGCSISLSSTVTVNPLPVFTAVGSNSPLCEGSTLNLTAQANAGATYYWTGPNGFTSNVQNPVITNVSTNNGGTYVVTASLNGCSTSTNIGVVINTAPVISTIGSNSPVCQGSNLSLYAGATSGSSYSWTGPNGFTSNVQNPVINNATTANAGTYVVTASLNTCSSSSSTVVNVVATPNANITGNLDICVGSSTTLTATGGSSYLWSPGGATTASITVSPSATTTYSVVVTASGGCSATAFATVVVNPVPVINITSSNNNICEGEDVILTAAGATTYLWSNGATTPSITVMPSTTTTYTVTGTSSSGCTATGNITVTVGQKPIVTLNLPQSEICVDANPLTLTGGNPVGGTYYGSGIFGGLFYPSTVGVGTYNIHYEYTNNYGCKATATKLLTVNPLPTVLFNAISPNPVPLGTAAFQLNTGIPLGGSYSGPGVVNGWFHPSIAGLGQHTISYTYTDFKNCVNVAMQTIKVEGYIGIEEVSSDLIRIYPNPVHDYLNIEMESIPKYIEVFNLPGKSLLTQKVDSEKFGLDVSHLSKGVYFVRFVFEDGSMGTTKFIK